MSWLRSSPLRQSFSRSNRGRTLENDADFDLKACYDSFCKHWQQVYDIILKVEPNKPSNHDDVLGVVNHLDHMVTLLLVELRNCNKITLPGAITPSAPCQEFLLSENLLDKLYEWGKSTGRYANAVRLEQLKLYELLVSHSRHQLLVHEPFLRPLLKILASSDGEIFPPDVEKRLVILLNQLCVVLMQNVHLLDLFFCSSSQQNGHGTTNFIIFSLLIPYVHRDGSLGHQARDALLLCMSLSQKNSNIGTYIAKYSSMCTVLVTGLGGLYSVLPNTIEIIAADWHRITPDDVTEISELMLFMNALEFCNAVVQVAHELIRDQLLDVMYLGFIVPVLGPALLQIFKGNHLQNNIESQISAMAYLDLILRSVTEPGLLKIFVKFLLDVEKFDGQRIIDVLVDRINSVDTRLCMVTLALFDTLLALHCEDIMFELLLKFLLPCKHIPIQHRHKVNRTDFYSMTVDYFLDLSPEVMKLSNGSGGGDCIAENDNTSLTQQQQQQQHHQQQQPMLSKTIGANWNHYGQYSGDSLYSNYRAYLFDARIKISQCQRGCDRWTSLYRFQSPNCAKRSEKKLELIKQFLIDFSKESCSNSGISNSGGAGGILASDKKQLDSLQSLGESSSGYESFKYRIDDDDDTISEDLKTKQKFEHWKQSSQMRNDSFDNMEFDFADEIFDQEKISLGPFLCSLWGKLQTFTSNCLYVNLHLTGLITRLAWYPLPLTHTLFLRPDIPITSDTPSFYQLLKILKQQIDAELPVNEESLELIDLGRADLIDREFRLVNTRKNAVEGMSKSPAKNGFTSYSQTTTSNLSATTPPQLTASSSYDPFKRNDSKRKSITSSLSNMFKRPSANNNNNNNNSSASSGLSQIFEFFTGGSSSSSSSNILSSGTPAILNSQIRDTTNNKYQQLQHQHEPTSLDLMSSMTSTILGAIPGSSSGNSGPGSLTSNGTKERIRDLSLCAVILDEWLKELSAISQEHSIVMLSSSAAAAALLDYRPKLCVLNDDGNQQQQQQNKESIIGGGGLGST